MLKKGKLEKILGRDRNKVNNFKSSNFYIFTFYKVPWEMTVNCPLPQAFFKDHANSKLAYIIFHGKEKAHQVVTNWAYLNLQKLLRKTVETEE